MKLIAEIVEDVEYITEGTNKELYIEGIFLQSEMKNRNGRIYPKNIMEREVSRYMKEYVQAGRAFGELGHPEGPTINLDRVSHMITSLKENGNNFVGRAKIMNTPMGNIVKNLIDGGAKLGVSSRGMGSLKINNDGINEVQDDFELICFDLVSSPSTPGAYLFSDVNERDNYEENLEEEKKVVSGGNVDASIDLMRKLSDYLGK